MRGAIVAACLAITATPLSAQAPAQPAAAAATYDKLVRLYRGGSFEQASSELRYQSLVWLDGSIVREWSRLSRRQDRREDLAAALMLHTEVVFDEVAADPVRLRDNVVVRLNVAAIDSVHQELRGLSPVTPLLRSWYVMWEAFRQGFSLNGSAPLSDHLATALAAFPDDAELLLAAGSRHEQRWWNASRNPLRDPSPRPRETEPLLQDARRHLERSVVADPKLVEAHIRLGRVLTQLGAFDAAGEHLTGPATSGQQAFEYLRLLFLGDVHEHQHDAGGAAAAYEEAIGLAPTAQTARLAAAQLGHSLGRRNDAARAVLQAMDGPLTTIDPWWFYLRGQWWRVGSYLKRTRALVIGAAAEKATR